MVTAVESALRELSKQSQRMESNLRDIVDLIPPSGWAKMDDTHFWGLLVHTGIDQAEPDKDLFSLKWQLCVKRIADHNRHLMFFVSLRYFGGTFSFYPSNYHRSYFLNGAHNDRENVLAIIAKDVSQLTDSRITQLCSKLQAAMEQLDKHTQQKINEVIKTLGPDVEFLFSQAFHWKTLHRARFQEIEEMRRQAHASAPSAV